MIPILVIDDLPDVREGYAAVLCEEPQFDVVGRLRSAEEALTSKRMVEPRVVFVGQRLSGMDGISACGWLLKRWPRTHVVVLLTFPRPAVVLAAFAAGARGVLVKETDPSAIRQAVRCVAQGGTYIDPAVGRRLIDLALEVAPGAASRQVHRARV